MDLDIPVLARNIPGNAAIITHKETGLLFSNPQVRKQQILISPFPSRGWVHFPLCACVWKLGFSSAQFFSEILLQSWVSAWGCWSSRVPTLALQFTRRLLGVSLAECFCSLSCFSTRRRSGVVLSDLLRLSFADSVSKRWEMLRVCRVSFSRGMTFC